MEHAVEVGGRDSSVGAGAGIVTVAGAGIDTAVGAQIVGGGINTAVGVGVGTVVGARVGTAVGAGVVTVAGAGVGTAVGAGVGARVREDRGTEREGTTPGAIFCRLCRITSNTPVIGTSQITHTTTHDNTRHRSPSSLSRASA